MLSQLYYSRFLTSFSQELVDLYLKNIMRDIEK